MAGARARARVARALAHAGSAPVARALSHAGCVRMSVWVYGCKSDSVQRKNSAEGVVEGEGGGGRGGRVHVGSRGWDTATRGGETRR